MNAIKQLRKYLERDPSTPSAGDLTELVSALAEEREYSLGKLYRLSYDEFNLAIELLKDWRLDRYYASRIQLFDLAEHGAREEAPLRS